MPPLSSHTPVMLHEVLEFLSPRDGAIYVDATFGAGGYSEALLEAADCTVWGIDRDPAAIARGAALEPIEIRQALGISLVLVRGRHVDRRKCLDIEEGVRPVLLEEERVQLGRPRQRLADVLEDDEEGGALDRDLVAVVRAHGTSNGIRHERRRGTQFLAMLVPENRGADAQRPVVHP